MDRLLSRLRRIERGAGLREGIGRACREVVERAAVRNCPVDTGNLQEPLHIRLDDLHRIRQRDAGQVGAAADGEYAYGTDA